jgi:hypothetical protein
MVRQNKGVPLKKLVLLGVLAALLVPAVADAATATVSTSTTGSSVQVFYVGTDAARITYSPGVSLAPTTQTCTRVGGRNICRQNYAVTGNSINCSSSSYSFSGSYPLSTAPLDFQTLLRSSVACRFSLTIRTVGAGTVSVTTTHPVTDPVTGVTTNVYDTVVTTLLG